MRGKCERRGGNINADGAGAEVFVGDGCSQGASFGPMAAISRRGQGGRIYNNTRARVLLRRMCVKPADLTTHSPPKTSARPRTATRPSRALPLPHAVPTHAHAVPNRARRLREAFPAEVLRSSPHSDTPFPSTSAPPRNPDARPQAAQRIPRSPHNSLPAAPRCLPFRSASGTKKRHRTVHVRCRMFRSTVVAVGHLDW